VIMDIEENEDYVMYTSIITPQSSTNRDINIDMAMPASLPKECFRNLECKTDEVQAAERGIEPCHGIFDDKVLPLVQSRLEAKVTLDAHYNNTFHHQWHLWEFKKAKEAEFSEAIKATFNMLYDAPKKKVLFVIGLSKFSSNSKLTLLHGSFGSQLIRA
ncbi:hypothetical protein BGZ92_006596, partial [Podila epicladia]